jgi:hypothetical protein
MLSMPAAVRMEWVGVGIKKDNGLRDAITHTNHLAIFLLQRLVLLLAVAKSVKARTSWLPTPLDDMRTSHVIFSPFPPVLNICFTFCQQTVGLHYYYLYYYYSSLPASSGFDSDQKS